MHNVRANAIAPGVINTPATAAGFAGPHAEWGRRIAAQVPLRRFGGAAEVAALAALPRLGRIRLCQRHLITIDGGKSAELYVPAPVSVSAP